MNTLEYTKKLMKENNIFAKKAYGQNFLIDDSVLSDIVEMSQVDNSDTVIEIGPGLGNLTQYILEKNASVYAFEIDKDMIDILGVRFREYKNFNLINQDIMKVNLKEDVKDKKIKIIANLPYYITTPILFKLLEYKEYIESITVMVQKEVADRIIAKPHGKDYGVLTININTLADVYKLFDVPNNSFIPAPNVTSSVIKIVPNKIKETNFGIKNMEIFNEVVKKSFAARRKKLLNSLEIARIYNLSKEQLKSILNSCSIDENARAEELEIKKFVEISNKIYEKTQD